MASVDGKQKLVGLMFTEKLIFTKDGFQTPRMNEVLSLIMMIDNNLEAQKKGLKKNFVLQSREVSLQGFKPLHTNAHRCTKFRPKRSFLPESVLNTFSFATFELRKCTKSVLKW